MKQEGLDLPLYIALITIFSSSFITTILTSVYNKCFFLCLKFLLQCNQLSFSTAILITCKHIFLLGFSAKKTWFSHQESPHIPRKTREENL